MVSPYLDLATSYAPLPNFPLSSNLPPEIRGFPPLGWSFCRRWCHCHIHPQLFPGAPGSVALRSPWPPSQDVCGFSSGLLLCHLTALSMLSLSLLPLQLADASTLSSLPSSFDQGSLLCSLLLSENLSSYSRGLQLSSLCLTPKPAFNLLSSWTPIVNCQQPKGHIHLNALFSPLMKHVEIGNNYLLFKTALSSTSFLFIK